MRRSFVGSLMLVGLGIAVVQTSAQRNPANGSRPSTIVAIAFVGPSGEPARVVEAQLLLTAWGVSEEETLRAEENVLRFDLDAARPEWVGGFSDARAHLYVRTDGFVTIISEPFTWLSDKSPTTTLNFRNGRSVGVRQGQPASLTVQLRKPEQRRIRLVDESGRAQPGLDLEVAAHWDTPNHCGRLIGVKRLVAGTTNRLGVLEVPDVDAEYALTLTTRRVDFVVPSPDSGDLVTRLTSTETLLSVHRYRRQPLAIDVVKNGKPVAGAAFWADMGLGTCGAGSGVLATSDARGRIRSGDYYPEEWKDHWLCSEGKQVWMLSENETIPSRIDLSSVPAPAQVPVDACRQ